MRDQAAAKRTFQYENSRWCTEWRSKNDSVVKLDDSDEIRICEDSDEIRICCTVNDNVVKLDDSSSVLKQGDVREARDSAGSSRNLLDLKSLSECILGSRDGAWWDDAISKEDSEDVDDEGIVEKMVKVNLPKVSPNG
ncbi:hypothetical protein Tco_1381466, partial [Tanacetum coccineum]